MTDNHPANAKRLLWAGFMAILAAGVGFGIRGGIFADWGADYGFSAGELGKIGGAGFTGFCFGIMIGGVVVDKIGYGKLVAGAFLFHVLSAFVTFGANPSQSPETAYQFLFWGMFLFALANGTLEAVSNPLVATLFPENRNHYLNILHASWPLGMIFGGMVGWFLGKDGGAGWDWKWQLSLYLLPTFIYGAMFFKQKFPKSEASAKGLKFGEMMKDVGILGGLVVSGMLYLFFESTLAPFFPESEAVPGIIAAVIALGTLTALGMVTKWAIGHWLIFVLFITHALVGAVELGTDGWIQNITGAILTPKEGKILFVITSLAMFLLRFCAHTIETKAGLKPISLLFVCAILACIGLNLVSAVSSFGPAVGALLVYALGKTFFWPTMLAVVGDRFPATGAIAMSLMGGIGMMSAGLIGTPGLGYAKDRLTTEALVEDQGDAALVMIDPEKKSSFLGFDEVAPVNGKLLDDAKSAEVKTPEQKSLIEADIEGARGTLRVDSLIPAAMALIFLLLMFYFRTQGGYRAITLEEASGGVEGPVR